jgi:hypothetical protein
MLLCVEFTATCSSGTLKESQVELQTRRATSPYLSTFLSHEACAQIQKATLSNPHRPFHEKDTKNIRVLVLISLMAGVRTDKLKTNKVLRDDGCILDCRNYGCRSLRLSPPPQWCGG